MSIIQEALKKAQGTYARSTDQPQSGAVAKGPAADKILSDANPAAASDSLPQKLRHAVAAKPMFIPSVIVLTIIAGFGLKVFLADTSSARKAVPAVSQREASRKTSDNPAGASIQEGPGAAAKAGTTGTIASIKSSIPAAFVSSQAPNLTLNGIMYLRESPRAIINGSMVEEGDSVSGAKIIAINSDNVTLDYNNAEIILKLK